jgi:hypothetical protein
MFIARRNRPIGRWSALLAAYAFALNALLATTLLAATPPAKSLSGFELCTAAADSAASQFDHDDKATKRAAVHCRICLQHAAPVALAPPSDLSLPLPIARSVTVAAVRNEAPDRDSGYSPHSPRGPPDLG